jgi:hypothetical protein
MHTPPGAKLTGGVLLWVAVLALLAATAARAAENPLNWPERYEAKITLVSSGPPTNILLYAEGGKLRQENIIYNPNSPEAVYYHKVWICRPDTRQTYAINPLTRRYVAMPLEEAPRAPERLLGRAIWQKLDDVALDQQIVEKYRVIAFERTPRDYSRSRLPWEKIFFGGGSDTTLCWVEPMSKQIVKSQDEPLESVEGAAYYQWEIKGKKTGFPPEIFEPPASYTPVDKIEQLDGGTSP